LDLFALSCKALAKNIFGWCE